MAVLYHILLCLQVLTFCKKKCYSVSMEKELHLKLIVRLFTDDHQRCFGPGIATLLHRVEERRSLRAAAASMDMAYSKAWRIIRTAEEVFGWFLTQLPLWLMAMITGLIGAAIMSTCNSAVQSTTVSIVYDVYRNLINPGADEKKLRNLSRIVAAVVLTVSVVLGLKFPNVLNLITTSYSYGVAVLLVPMYVGFLLRKKNFLTRQGCYCSMAAGLVGCLVFQALGTTIPFVMFGLIFSLVGLLAGSALTKKPQAA